MGLMLAYVLLKLSVPPTVFNAIGKSSGKNAGLVTTGRLVYGFQSTRLQQNMKLYNFVQVQIVFIDNGLTEANHLRPIFAMKHTRRYTGTLRLTRFMCAGSLVV